MNSMLWIKCHHSFGWHRWGGFQSHFFETLYFSKFLSFKTLTTTIALVSIHYGADSCVARHHPRDSEKLLDIFILNTFTSHLYSPLW